MKCSEGQCCTKLSSSFVPVSTVPYKHTNPSGLKVAYFSCLLKEVSWNASCSVFSCCFHTKTCHIPYAVLSCCVSLTNAHTSCSSPHVLKHVSGTHRAAGCPCWQYLDPEKKVCLFFHGCKKHSKTRQEAHITLLYWSISCHIRRIWLMMPLGSKVKDR
jgi:hypothetical protein